MVGKAKKSNIPVLILLKKVFIFLQKKLAFSKPLWYSKQAD